MGLRRPLALSVVFALTASLLLLAPSSGGADVSSSWGSVTDLSSTGVDATDPQIEISADGSRAIAVWLRGGVIQARVATMSGGIATWGPLEDFAASTAEPPAVALDTDGTHATVVWDGGAGDFIRARSATVSGNSATWGITRTVSGVLPPGFTDPDVALSAAGDRATAVWVDPGTTRIRSASSTISGNDASWEGGVTNISPAGSASRPVIRVSDDGAAAIAAWRRDSVVESAVATVAGAAATWGTATTLSAPGGSAERAGTTLSDDGVTATATWLRSNGSHIIAQSRSATISGIAADWGPMTELSAPGQDAANVTVAAASAGDRVIATWDRNGVLQSRVGTVNGNTGTWGSITAVVGSGAAVPQVQMSASGGRSVVIWRQSDTVIQTAAAEVSGTTGTWQTPVTVSATGGAPSPPGVSLSADGITAVATWTRSDGTSRIAQSNTGILVGTAPSVTAVSPASGGTSGGTPVTVTGTGFLSGATVSLGGSACTSPTVVSTTSITCSTPAHAAGAVAVTVTNPDTASGSLAGGYTYTDGASPTSRPTAAPTTTPTTTPTTAPTTQPTTPPPLISKPGVVNRLKASNFRKRKVQISWRPPSATGSSPIVKYRIRWTKPNRKTNYRSWHEQTSTKRTLKGMRKRAKYNVQVQAANAVGYGSWMTVGFRQKK